MTSVELRPAPVLRPTSEHWSGLRRVLTGTSLAPLVVLGVMLGITRSAQIDDAFITYRYAFNLDAGRGLVFNPGQRVEGMSNLLWTLLLAGVHKLGIAIPTASAAMSIVALAATVVLVRRLGVRIGLPPWGAVILACSVAGTVEIVAAGTMGLEGALYGALLLAALATWDGDNGLKQVALVSALIGLAATRPEGMVIALLLAATRLRQRWQPLAGVAVGIAVIEGFRLIYYGRLLPTSVTAKSDVGTSVLAQLRRHAGAGLAYLQHALGLSLVVIALAGLVLTLVAVFPGQERWWARLPPVLAPASLVLAAGFGLALFTGGDWMPDARLISPYLPLLYLLVAGVLCAVGVRWALVLGAVLPLAMAGLGPHSLAMQDGAGGPLSTNASFDSFGRALAHANLGDRYVASATLGQVAYYAPNVRFSDIEGLTVPAVAETREAGSVFGKTNYPYTMSLHPAVVTANTWYIPVAVVESTHSTNQYEALVGPRLESGEVFALVDVGDAQQVLTQVRRFSDPQAHLQPVANGLATWQLRFPHGQ